MGVSVNAKLMHLEIFKWQWNSWKSNKEKHKVQINIMEKIMHLKPPQDKARWIYSILKEMFLRLPIEMPMLVLWKKVQIMTVQSIKYLIKNKKLPKKVK